jgi:mono/diheme cytochrome c family protein
MPGFDGILDDAEIRELRAYLETRAEQDGVTP